MPYYDYDEIELIDEDDEADLVKEAQERKVRLETLTRIYEQTDRVITGDPIIVNLVDNGPAPAWSDGKSVTFNMDEIEDFDIEELTQLNGLNYHELAHLEYTPRKSSKIVEYVLDNNLMHSFNILEDQRIETLITGRFPAIAPYLQATIARWLASSPQDIMTNYVCIRGRRYLPMDLRIAFRDQFILPNLIPEITRIVDEYRLLAFPEDYDRAQILIKEFQDNVLSKMPQPPSSGGPNGCGNRAPTTSGRAAKGKQQRKDGQRSQRMQGQGDPAPATNNDEDLSDGNPDVDEQLDARNQNASQDTNQKSDQQNQQKPFSLKPGQGHIRSVGGIPDDLGKVLKRTIEDALSRKDVQMDIKSKQRVLFGGDGKHTDGIRKGKYDSTPVPPDLLMIAKRFQRELEQLRSDSEPYWEKEMPSGKLNVPRVVRGCEPDAAFDRWDEGNDSTDIEAVILVDRSGSMGSGENDRLASHACWVIKRALEAIEAPVTVYAFDDQSEIAYSRTEKADRTQFKFIYGNGGTNPNSGLMEAERLLISSRAKSKIMFLITDGQFSAEGNDDVIKRMANRGVLTAFALIMGENDYSRYKQWGYFSNENEMYHGAEIKARVDSAASLIPMAKSIVIGAIKKRSMAR